MKKVLMFLMMIFVLQFGIACGDKEEEKTPTPDVPVEPTPDEPTPEEPTPDVPTVDIPTVEPTQPDVPTVEDRIYTSLNNGTHSYENGESSEIEYCLFGLWNHPVLSSAYREERKCVKCGYTEYRQRSIYKDVSEKFYSRIDELNLLVERIKEDDFLNEALVDELIMERGVLLHIIGYETNEDLKGKLNTYFNNEYSKVITLLCKYYRNNVKKMPSLDFNILEEIYKASSKEEVTNPGKLVTFYGEYSGSYAVLIDGIALTVVTTVNVAGVSFIYPDSNVIEIYNDGKFYTLQNAFDLGLITFEDLLQIHGYYSFKNGYIFPDVESEYINIHIVGTDNVYKYLGERVNDEKSVFEFINSQKEYLKTDLSNAVIYVNENLTKKLDIYNGETKDLYVVLNTSPKEYSLWDLGLWWNKLNYLAYSEGPTISLPALGAPQPEIIEYENWQDYRDIFKAFNVVYYDITDTFETSKYNSNAFKNSCGKYISRTDQDGDFEFYTYNGEIVLFLNERVYVSKNTGFTDTMKLLKITDLPAFKELNNKNGLYAYVSYDLLENATGTTVYTNLEEFMPGYFIEVESEDAVFNYIEKVNGIKNTRIADIYESVASEEEQAKVISYYVEGNYAMYSYIISQGKYYVYLNNVVHGERYYTVRTEGEYLKPNYHGKARVTFMPGNHIIRSYEEYNNITSIHKIEGLEKDEAFFEDNVLVITNIYIGSSYLFISGNELIVYHIISYSTHQQVVAHLTPFDPNIHIEPIYISVEYFEISKEALKNIDSIRHESAITGMYNDDVKLF